MKQNLIYFHTHDTGNYYDVYGYDSSVTANITQFANEALVFDNAFTVNPTCSPSRACMLTGTYPQKNGMLGLAHRGFNLANDDWHLASYLKANGYHTALSGIQHEKGFWINNDMGQLSAQRLGYETFLTSKVEVKNDQDYINWDPANVENTINFIKEYDEDRPFFISMGLFSTHREYPEIVESDVLPDEFPLPRKVNDNPANVDDTKKFVKSLKVVDTSLKQLIETLKEKGIYDNTVILLTTDHGLANPFAKCTLSDEGTKVALMIRAPHLEKSIAKRTESLVSQVDVYPTICDILDVEKPEHLEGNSVIDLFEDQTTDVNEFVVSLINFHTSYEPARCVRTKKYKYIKYFDETWTKYNLSNCDDSVIKDEVMEQGWENWEKPMEQFYDLENDPNEEINLIDSPEHAELIKEYKLTLNRWQKNHNDKIYTFDEYNGIFKVNTKECKSPKHADYESIVAVPTEFTR